MNGRESERPLIPSGRQSPPAHRASASPVLRDLGRWVLTEAARRAQADQRELAASQTVASDAARYENVPLHGGDA